MEESVPTDQQTDLIGDEKESLAKFDPLHWVGDILKAFNCLIIRLAAFIRLTEEERREAGVYFGDSRND